jgi:hypothetical protein
LHGDREAGLLAELACGALHIGLVGFGRPGHALPEASAPVHPMQEQNFVLAVVTSAVHVDENLPGDAKRGYAGAGCCSLR